MQLELNVQISKFCDKNRIKDSMSLEDLVNNSNLWNKGLHDILELEPVIILIILSSCKEDCSLFIEFPHNTMPYSTEQWKYANQIILRVGMLL
jgi:hypothetical protein